LQFLEDYLPNFKKIKNQVYTKGLGMVVHACNLSYMKGGDWSVEDQGQPRQKRQLRYYLSRNKPGML
jgi:hypothetical protein